MVSEIFCPCCRTVALDMITDGETGLELDTCPTCLGIWFDAAELKEFYSSPELQKRLIPAGGGSAHHTYEISTKARACPRCRTAMERPHVGGVALDVCRHCRGIWFDYGELQKITQIHRTRGLSGDDVVTDQVRQGLKGQSSGRSGALEVLNWFLNSFLSSKIR